jgi:GPH family glycoside/pentoside/hexuronide:cation symporter
MTIKKEMTTTADETNIKVHLTPGDTLEIVSSKLANAIHTAKNETGSDFDKTVGALKAIPGLFLKERPVVEAEPTKIPPLRAIFSTLKNKPFVSYLIISMIMSTAFTMVTTMMPYYMIYQLRMADAQTLIMVLMMGALALCLVPCSMVSGKIGKAKTYALGITIASLGLAIAFFLSGQGNAIFYLAAIVGLGFSSQWVCPHSMMPDVIEQDELVTGERREGIYFGMNATAGQITGALGSAICGWGLKLGGYVEGAEQTASALTAIRGMFALIPALLLLVCVPLLIRYPITRESHAQVLKQLEERRKEQSK